VGLVYDHVNDILSADTRNGATLKLKVGAIGYFAEEKLLKKTIPIVREESHLDWTNTNNKLFEMYENIYLDKCFQSTVNESYFEEVRLQASSIMKDRFRKYSI
jgi:hypothetical protein